MRKVNWKLALKISGVLLCAFIFILFAVLILQNDLNPLALDIAARDFVTIFVVKNTVFVIGFSA